MRELIACSRKSYSLTLCLRWYSQIERHQRPAWNHERYRKEVAIRACRASDLARCCIAFVLHRESFSLPRRTCVADRASVRGEHALEKTFELLDFVLGEATQPPIEHPHDCVDKLGLNRAAFLSELEVDLAPVVGAPYPSQQSLFFEAIDHAAGKVGQGFFAATIDEVGEPDVQAELLGDLAPACSGSDRRDCRTRWIKPRLALGSKF
jgi:hypothetical protein